MKKCTVVIAFLLFVFAFNVSAETYYQNTNSYPISVPTAGGSTVEVLPGKFLGGTYYAFLADLKIVTLYSGTPAASDITYTYPVDRAIQAILPDQTAAEGKFLQSSSALATCTSVDSVVDIDAVLPAQTTANGKFLKSVTGVATWETLPAGITNGAGNNIITKSNGTNLVASSITDNGTTVSTALTVTASAFQLTSKADPTCGIGTRGQSWFLEGGDGVKDSVSVCTKDAGNSYAWREIY